MDAFLASLSSSLVIDWQTTLNLVIVPWTAKLLVAVVAAIVTIVLANKIKASVRKSLAATRADRSTILLTSRIAQTGVLILGVVVELGIFGTSWTALLALVSVVSLAISLAVQDVLKSFVAGIYLLIERPFRIGETVRLKDFSGEVEHVGIRTTMLRTEEGFQVVVPNSTIFVEVIVNKGIPSGTLVAQTGDIDERPQPSPTT